ncbi:hypothetical protein [Actinomadura rupiterrae]|uniref:hypothetical protein n=1 Tax=Actinomadura rupiterrae TaxID=559627 RepID=UPI0020A36D9C|nr:hypothetical protein [Actinomadura rupiterrae]MCP2340907.1 hypothetical protein [Actinomadura rupiterrae]
MSSTTRWTLFVVLLAVNVGYQLAFHGTWHQIVVSAVTGAGIIGLLVEYLVRGRRER